MNPAVRSNVEDRVIYRLLADATVVLHLAFVVFVVFGGLLVIWRRWLAWAHVPAAVWGVWIEFAGWMCPLTPLENWFRERGGRPVYASGFVEHYVVPILYPSALSRDLQWLLGGLVLVINVAIYVTVLRRARREGGATSSAVRSPRDDRSSE
jgi:hypothetical protein